MYCTGVCELGCARACVPLCALTLDVKHANLAFPPKNNHITLQNNQSLLTENIPLGHYILYQHMIRNCADFGACIIILHQTP